MMRRVLTEPQRQKVCGAVLVLALGVVPMSLSLIATTAYLRIFVDEELDLVQGLNTATLPYFLAVTGTVNALTHLALLSAVSRAHRPFTRAAALGVMLVASVVVLVATLLVFAALIFCCVQMALLSGYFEAGLQSAMQDYSFDPHTKARLDLLQMEYSCCGDGGYRDWFLVPWVPQDVLVAPPREVLSQIPPGSSYMNDDVPFSCCDPGSARPCIHHHVTTDRLHHSYDHRLATTLHTAGCREALSHFFGHTLLRGVVLGLVAMLFAQVLMLVLCRLVQTSMLTAVQTGDMLAPAEGYLFKPSHAGPGAEKDAEVGEKQGLLGGLPPPPGGDAMAGVSSQDEEGETDRPPSSALTDPPLTTPMSLTDEEPIYENVIRHGDESEPLYDDEWGEGGYYDPGLPFQGQHGQPPLFPSEMAEASAEDRGGHNSSVASGSACSGARRRNSRAFESLGIPAPQPTTPGRPPYPPTSSYPPPQPPPLKPHLHRGPPYLPPGLPSSAISRPPPSSPPPLPPSYPQHPPPLRPSYSYPRRPF